MISRVRIMRINPDLSTEQVLVFRVSDSDQNNVEDLGHRLQTRWMELNPGVPTQMVVDWPRPAELGAQHIMPSRKDS